VPERYLIGANNGTKFLFRIWSDDEIRGQLLVIMQNPASPCKRTKPQSNNHYKLLSLLKVEYFVPKITTSSSNSIPQF